MSLLWGGGQYRDLASSEDLSAFASAIATMTKEAQKDDSEEFQKNVIAQFLSTTFDYVCNTRGKVDLAIYDDDIPKVLFEVKSLSNKAEFVKKPDFSLQRQSQNRSASSLRSVANAEASVRSTDPHLQIQSYRHSEGAKRPKNPQIKGEFLDSSLRTSCYAQNDKYSVDCHKSRSDSRNDKWGLESKAFYESILYYLREFKAHKNNNIKHIILCTAHEFYFINAKAYHKLFVSNTDKAIQKHIDTAYSNCGKKQGTGNDTSTNKFYAEIEAILPDIDATLEFYYVNVANLANNKSAKNPRDLALLYALLSPNFLLQIPRYIDANTLNERFYKELLYILGLVQIEQEGKALILPSTTPNTLLHSIKRDFADKLPRESSDFSDSNALDSRQNALDSDDLAQSHKGESTQNPSHPQDSQNPSQDSKHTQNPNDSQTSHDSADIFDSHIFPLIMLWNNRILFLRLLESMLLSFRHIDKPFLDISILRDFGALNVLFFKVLAVKNRADIPPNLAEIPYLNSSLFEKSALELQGFEIATLESRPLKIAPDSILRRDKTLHDRYVGKDECLPLLEYLFAFLHAYDFTTTPSDVQNYAKTNHDKLINSAVLGLVFEKLNGYKEGSFYTPSFITRYMCESSIRKVVVEKFNSTNPQWQCKTLADIEYEIHREIRQARNTPDSSLRGGEAIHKIDTHPLAPSAKEGESLDCHELKNPLPCGGDLGEGKSTQSTDSRNGAFIDDSNNDSTKEVLAKYNKIFLSIRICDPAVGSGHFLVSALNELIAIKHELGLLLDCDGVRLSDIDLVLENDELLIKDSQGQMLDYTIPAHERIEAHKIQKALFYTKKELIENCLFGVDINPNSVEICKLRLWIELLKYSYYENIATKELQTLPNIDINIKCGNSLISYFDLRQSLSHYPNIAVKIKQYQQAVRDYKEGIFANRTQINATIKELLQSFRNFCFSDKFKKEIKSFHAKCKSYSKKYGNFLAKDDENLRLYVAQSFGYFDFDEDKARADFATLKKEYESIFSLESNKPFEWRFEFPEVLDSEGDFMGFDLIIGNPPYIRQEEIKELKPHLQKSFSIYCGTSDIYTYFYERGHSLLKAKGILTLITSNKFCRAGYGANLRAFLLQSAILDFVDLNGVKVFDKATVDTCIVNLSKQKPTKSHALNYANPNAKDLSTLNYSQIPQDSLSSEAFIFVDSPTLALKQKIEKIGTPLKQWDIEIYRGVLTGYNEAFIIDTATKDRILADCDDTDKSRKSFPTTATTPPQTPPARGGAFSASPSLARGDSKDSPSLAEGARGWVNLTEKERTAQIIKPILRGRDIKRYSYEWANLWLIGTFPALKLNIDDYPALKKYLETFMPRIAQSGEKGCRKKTSNKWFETQDNIAYYEDFEKPKLIWAELARTGNSFIFETKQFSVLAGVFLMTDKNNDSRTLKYLNAILNNPIALFYLEKVYSKLDLTGWQWKKAPVEKIPIPKINAKNQKIADKIVNLVDKILQSKAQGKDSTESESQIDDLVYQLYDLTHDEIQIIESK